MYLIIFQFVESKIIRIENKDTYSVKEYDKKWFTVFL